MSSAKDRERSPLPHNAEELDPDQDYFLKQAEFRVWLRDDKGKYVDELSGEKSRSYFRKFVKRWNSGKLDDTYYSGNIASQSVASSNTGYRWSFAGKESKKDATAIEQARASVSQATNQGESRTSSGPSTSNSSRRVAGPTLPSASDWIDHQESHRSLADQERKYSRKREREEDKERVEDLVGPRETGREGMLEKKRLKRESDRAARGEKEDTLQEVGDDALYGSADSFKARLAQRDAARKRFEEKRQGDRMTRESESSNRVSAMREKDKANMSYLQALAKERFG